MPLIKRKAPPPATYEFRLGPAVGSTHDFYALARIPEFDELERERDPEHFEHTYVLRFQGAERSVVARVKTRLDALWRLSTGLVVAVGESRGYLEIGPAGVQEVGLPDVPGTFMSIWGAFDDSLFFCGLSQPFVLLRYAAAWYNLPLPEGVEALADVCGFHVREVYFVGDDGTILVFDGQTIAHLDVPTTQHLTGIARLDDRTMCVSGYHGTLLMGNRNGWRLVPSGTDEELLSIAALDGSVYYGSEQGLWAFDGHSTPKQVAAVPVRWVAGLDDGLLLSYVNQAFLYREGAAHPIDTQIRAAALAGLSGATQP